MKPQFIILGIFWLISLNLFAQQKEKFGYSIEIGGNISDVEFGQEYLIQYLPNEDYNSAGTSGSPSHGYNLNIGLQCLIHPKYAIHFQTGYSLFSYGVRGFVRHLKSSINRPVSNEIPVSLDGKINYPFWNFNFELIHNFRGNKKRGIVSSIGLDYMLNLNTNWNVNVMYETGENSQKRKIPERIAQNLSNLLMVDVKCGYNFVTKSGLEIIPSLGLNVGLNELGEFQKSKITPYSYSINLKFLK